MLNGNTAWPIILLVCSLFNFFYALYTEHDTVLKETTEKSNWLVISQFAQGVSTSELIDIYKYEYDKYTLPDGRF